MINGQNLACNSNFEFFCLPLQGSSQSHNKGIGIQAAGFWSLSTQNLCGPSTTSLSTHHMKLLNPITACIPEWGLTVGKMGKIYCLVHKSCSPSLSNSTPRPLAAFTLAYKYQLLKSAFFPLQICIEVFWERKE